MKVKNHYLNEKALFIKKQKKMGGVLREMKFFFFFLRLTFISHFYDGVGSHRNSGC